jgi:1,2-phenylacetyl-CoA epoxidase PaaB subunit
MPTDHPGSDVFEVFLQCGQGQAVTHVGTVRAGDPYLAWQAAKETYGRRDAVTLLWVLPRAAMITSTDADLAAMDARRSAPHRQPAFPITRRKARERGAHR